MKPSEIPFEYREILERIEALEKLVALGDTNDSHHEDSEREVQLDDLSIEGVAEVIFYPEAYLKLAVHALKHAHPSKPPSKWVEVIGILTGKIQNESTPLEHLVVTDYWAVGTGNAVSVNILNAEPVMEILSKKKADEFIVGWAHSHPSYTPYLSRDDIATQSRYQALWENSIAVVIDPTLINKNSYGLGVFRNASDLSGYYELDFEIEGLSTAAAYSTLNLLLEHMS